MGGHRERRGPRTRGLPERLAAAWSWGPDPVRTVLFLLLAPALLTAGALGAMGWTWWQRTLAGLGALAIGAYLLLVLVGARRRGRTRRAAGRPETRRS
ncbi:hypothetical protein [Streptomyces sp. NPDC059009]|uniref:hypothetical protein n=1 Tax=Streptomyces sp. NPDC059009 TaxID=3346694 RepID=UPI003698C7EF